MLRADLLASQSEADLGLQREAVETVLDQLKLFVGRAPESLLQVAETDVTGDPFGVEQVASRPVEQLVLLGIATRLDVGKLAVPESILRKTSSLGQSEWRVMRAHAAIGSAILDNSSSKILQASHVIALHHHERWDGAGYPNWIAGYDIPLWGRICAVGDVFDAVTSERPYKPAFPNEEALQLLEDGRGKYFGPRVVDVFFECIEDILVVQAKYRDAD